MSTCPNPFPLRSIPVPPEITAITSCNCGGLDWHRQNCTLWDVAPGQAAASIAEARRRLSGWTDQLNERLQQELLRTYATGGEQQ